MNSTMIPRTIDLFCGGGGSSWGAKAAGADIVCGVDLWSLATRTYESNFPGARGITALLDDDSRPSMLGDVGRIDLLLASPECTNHTCAKGARPRDEASKATARYVVNFARELGPRWVVVENVVQMRSWHGYDPLVADLRGLGYNVREQVLEADAFGVPQTRRRLFLLCDRETMPPLVRPGPMAVRTVRDHILQTGESWKSTPLFRVGRAEPTLERVRRATEALGSGVPFLVVYYGSDGAGGWQPLDRPIRTLTTLDRFGLVEWENGEPRLRMLQVPELKRAMGFSAGYRLPFGTRRDQIKMLGNGVCPPVMTAIVRTLTQSVSRTAAEEAERPHVGERHLAQRGLAR